MGGRILWTILSIATTCTLAVSQTSTTTTNNGPKPERWSRQIENSGFPGPTMNARHNPEDWIPINPNSPNSRASNGRVLNFGPQQPLFAAQSQLSFQHPQPQFLMQTQFIPPTFSGNDIQSGPIPQSQPLNHFPTLFGDHRFGGLSQVPQQQPLRSNKPGPNNPGLNKPNNSPFQFEFVANGHKSPLFQQLSPQFVNEQFFEVPDKNANKKQPLFESKFNTESFNQKPKKPHAQELLHHPPPPPPPQQSAPSAPSGPSSQIPVQQQGAQQPEEVQLLYVPLETYYQQQAQQQHQQQQQHQHPQQHPNQQFQQNTIFQNPLNQFINPNRINEFYTPQPVRPLTIQTTTPLPPSNIHKPKAHQPPLAMFMLQDQKLSRGLTVNDILDTLRRERSISVLDAITPDNQPNIFIGPSGLKTPIGYEKFDLPYLSGLDATRNDRKLDGFPFFVAPLSYQAPNGFTKIPLPHPHVGSVVFNDQKMILNYGVQSQTTRPEILAPVTQRQYNSNFISATPLPQKFDPLTRKYVLQGTTEGYRPLVQEQQYITEKPTHLPKQSFVYQRPSTAASASGTQFVNEDFFTLKKTKTPAPLDSSQFDPYNLFQQSIKSHTANHFDTTTRATLPPPTTTKGVPTIKEFIPQTTPSTFNSFSAAPNLVENYRFPTPSSVNQKSQFHEEFRSSTAAPSTVDDFPQNNHFEYTPISQEIPSKPKKVVNKFNFGQLVSPTTSAYPTETTRNEPSPTIPSRDVYFNQYSPKPVSPSFAPEPTPSDITFYNRDSQRQYETPGPHSNRDQGLNNNEEQITDAPPSNLEYYNNNLYHNQQPQQQYSNDLPFAEISGLQTTTEQYRIPSELPPINPNLPNMINSLMEQEEAERAVLNNDATESTTLPPITRRPIQRGRRPVQRLTTSTTENIDNGEEDQVTTTRRPVIRHRTRVPVTNNQNDQTQPKQRGQQHYRTSTLVRNRVRFNPSPEERSELKRNRVKVGSRDGDDEKNLDYQRDVLNQNYPAIKPSTLGTSPTTTSTTEAVQYVPEVVNQDSNQFAYNTESERPRDNVVTVMAESYPNFDFNPQSTPSSYFGNGEQPQEQQGQFVQGDNLVQKVEEEERLVYNSVQNNVPTEQPEVVRQPQTERVVLIGDKPRRHRVTTTTTEAPQTTTAEPRQSTIAGILKNRRPGFVVRRRTSTTTTEAPATTLSSASQDRFTVRSRARGESVTTPRNIPQIRGRIRQRTTTPAPENVESENEEAPVQQRKPVYRAQYRSRTQPKFALDTQETQWSTNHNLDSFQPIETNDYITRKYDIVDDLEDNEPEIITADPSADEQTFIFTVTPKNQAPVNNQRNDFSQTVTETENEISPRIASHLEEHVNEDSIVEATTSGKRRGIWKKVRVRPVDGFETAESQHISQPAYNTLSEGPNKNVFDSKLLYSNFQKGYYSDVKPVDGEIETASALTMDKDVDEVTEQVKTEDPITTVPEAKIDATEDEHEVVDFEATTILPEEEEVKDEKVIVEDNEEIPTNSPVDNISNEVPSYTTTENVYDEIKKSLSELFSSSPDNEDGQITTTKIPIPDEEKVVINEEEKVVEEEVGAVTNAPETKQEDGESEAEAVEEKQIDGVTELAHVVELHTEPEVKANVTEINRTYVIATSTSKQVSHETEICYRGRCIKSLKKDQN